MTAEEFVFCESATSGSEFHIRLLGHKGKCVHGGSDTASLCGRVPANQGFDTSFRITEKRLETATCKRCAELYLEAVTAAK